MLSDGLQFLQASLVENLLIENGPTLPAVDNNVGELFYLTVGTIGLYVYTATGWMAVGSSAPTLTAGTGINIVNNAINNTGIRSIVGDDNIDVTTLNGVATLGFTGVVPVSKGGTGTTSLPTGFLKSNGILITSVATIPGDLVTGDITGNSSGVTGTVPVSKGGTGRTTFTTGYLTASGTSITTTATIAVADLTGTIPITKGGTGLTYLPTGYLTSDGVTMTSTSTIPGSAINGNITGSASSITGVLSQANGGTGRTSWSTGYVYYNGNAFVPLTTISGSDISGSVANATLAATATLATTATTATTTSYLIGGSIGLIPVQTNTSQTGFITGGSAGRVLTSTGSNSSPAWTQPIYDIGMSYGGVAPAGDVMVFTANRPFQLPSSLTGSYASAHVAALASTVFTIYKKPAGGTQTQIGTMTFAAGASVATFSFTATVAFAVGDMIAFVLGTADTNLASVAVTFASNLT